MTVSIGPIAPPAPRTRAPREPNHVGALDAGSIPRHFAKAFASRPHQVREARRFLAEILAGCPIADEAILCVSELAANAVVHSASGEPGGTFWVHLTAVPGEYVRVEVCDQGGPWVGRDQDVERPHGLDIVRQLAARFGVDGDAWSGRIVWARLDLSGPGRSSGQPDLAHPDVADIPEGAASNAARPGPASGRAGSAGRGPSWPG